MENLKIPTSIAIIMDGNGRWGLLHKNSRTEGHKQGVIALENIIKICIELGIKTLSVYAFSTENWSRPKLEVNTLMFLFKNYLVNKKETLNEQGIKLLVSGSKEKVPSYLLETIESTCKYLENNEKLILNICFNYGGRHEIVDAVNSLLNDGYTKITEDDLSNRMYNNINSPDLVIRTGGDFRISNFMLWQIAYSELYFTPCLWPDFDREEFLKAIYSYQKRDRRFGGLSNEKK